MDPFDERILTVLGDGKPRGLHQLLGEVGFSHNTLRRHLARLERQGFILKAKKHNKGLGRPRFSYPLPPRLKRQISLILSEPFTEVVSLIFILVYAVAIAAMKMGRPELSRSIAYFA